MNSTKPYSELRDLTDKYFDLGSRIFLDDLIEHHLHITPKDLTVQNLKKILTWLEITASLIIEDQKIVQEYIGSAKKLAGIKP